MPSAGGRRRTRDAGTLTYRPRCTHFKPKSRSPTIPCFRNRWISNCSGHRLAAPAWIGGSSRAFPLRSTAPVVACAGLRGGFRSHASAILFNNRAEFDSFLEGDYQLFTEFPITDFSLISSFVAIGDYGALRFAGDPFNTILFGGSLSSYPRPEFGGLLAPFALTQPVTAIGFDVVASTVFPPGSFGTFDFTSPIPATAVSIGITDGLVVQQNDPPTFLTWPSSTIFQWLGLGDATATQLRFLRAICVDRQPSGPERYRTVKCITAAHGCQRIDRRAPKALAPRAEPQPVPARRSPSRVEWLHVSHARATPKNSPGGSRRPAASGYCTISE